VRGNGSSAGSDGAWSVVTSLIGMCEPACVAESTMPSGWDFFVSYTQADRGWAVWIAWLLEEAGYRVLVQAWDMVPGNN
jgi:TIR domain